MFSVKFSDGSYADFSEFLGVRVPEEFQSSDYLAGQFMEMMSVLKEEFDYQPNSRFASIRVKRNDPSFVRTLLDRSFASIEFEGDVPEPLIKNNTSGSIVE